ncbi:MAG: NADH-quinone oxidoreductase subunit M [Acidobacteria bacterium]|nr:MAG: NADH-quinone oxidoreductase subunit M [Acidobacteriota bacterium]
MPILSCITFLPLALALLLLAIPARREKAVAQVATWGSLIPLALSLVALFRYDIGDGGFQLVEARSWIPSLGVQYKLGVDGVSLLLIVLTNLLTFIALISSWSAVTVRVKEYYVSFLLLQVGMLGTFAALDMFLFYIFWELMLVPMYFIIGIWGGERKLYAALKFFLYTLLGSVLMLLGIIALYRYSGEVFGEATFDIEKLQQLGAHTAVWPLAPWVFLALFLGFAVKVPLFPFHTWLPDAHVEAPTAGSVILAGVLLKMGTYGFYRFSLPIFPVQTAENLWWMLALCVIGVVYGAMVAYVQKDWKKLVAYSSVSHLGLTMLGLFALNVTGVKGSVVQMINHGISTGALFLLVGVVYERRHTRLISEYGGLAKVMPIFAVFFFIMLLSSAGLPGLNGFVGEITILAGLAQVGGEAFSFFGHAPFWWVVLSATTLVLGAIYLFWLWQKTMFGELTNEKNRGLADLSWREKWTLLPLAALALGIGLYPKPVFDIIEAPVNRLVHEQVVPALRQAGSAVELPAETLASSREGGAGGARKARQSP